MALVLRGGTLIDGSGGEPVSDAVVVIEEERISRVGQRAQFPAPSEVLECDGLTLLPGLIDAHSHRGIANGIEAGVTCFEHGTFLDEATARRMAATGADLVPTFAVLRLMTVRWREWGVPEAVLPRLAGAEEAMAASMKLAVAAGVRVGAGSSW